MENKIPDTHRVEKIVPHHRVILLCIYTNYLLIFINALTYERIGDTSNVFENLIRTYVSNTDIRQLEG